jgi:outer membrane receptor for ferrienterochelin and colicin
MKNFKRSFAAVAVASTLGLAAPAFADNTTGVISGSSMTANGQELAGVTITIKNTETGLTRTVMSSENGKFRFPLLPTGRYDITATKDGYTLYEQKAVGVGLGGATLLNLSMQEEGVERIAVTGSAISLIDTTSSESGIVVNAEELDRLPVARNLSSVALLAPGTTQGDTGFGNLVSFGGSSVAENAYFVNGLNITNFRTSLGSSDVPFEMYENFEVKTGGYSAEFGRSTGGVMNATTKSGSNDFKWGINTYWSPDALREDRPNVKRTDEDGIDLHGSEWFVVNQEDKYDSAEFNLWASGALVEDKLFYYVLVNPTSRESGYANQNYIYDASSSDLFWGAKIDYYITEDHILELTAFSDESTSETTKTVYDPTSGQSGVKRDSDGNLYTPTQGYTTGSYDQKSGGSNFALKYTGILTDDLTVSAMYGVNKFDSSYYPADLNATYAFNRYTGVIYSEGTPLSSYSFENDKRTAYRIDFDYYVGDFFGEHSLRFGLDYEELDASNDTQRLKGGYYRYQGCNDEAYFMGEEDLSCGAAPYARVQYYINEGGFTTDSNAYYIQDNWQVTDQLALQIGLRNESFTNYNVENKQFIEVADQWAPRLGFSYDLFGDGDHKVFGSYGQYYLPIATNTNVRMASKELYASFYGYGTGINPDTLALEGFTANLDTFDYEFANGNVTASITADGKLKNGVELVDANIKPMYQDEYILGYQGALTDELNFGVRYTFRELAVTIEDVAIDYGFNKYLEDTNGGNGCTVCTGFHYYVLTNPGQDLQITTDPDGSGTNYGTQTFTIPGDYLGYPEAIREHTQVDLTLERPWDGVWSMDINYTWAKTEGNTEGYVNSDIEQSDAGITQSFDQPGFMDGAYGYLPQDRRHTLKVQTAFAITDDFRVGLDVSYQSGRPINKFGMHPTDSFASQYGAFAFYHTVGEPDPDTGIYEVQAGYRGEGGRTDDITTVNLNLTYDLHVMDQEITLRANVFNLLNAQGVTEYYEFADTGLGWGTTANGEDILLGMPEPDYGLPTNHQAPRYVTFSASMRF